MGRSKVKRVALAGRSFSGSAAEDASILSFGSEQKAPEEKYAQNYEDRNNDNFDKTHGGSSQESVKTYNEQR